MRQPVLVDEAIYPDEGVLSSALGDTFPAYSEFVSAIQSESIGCACLWKYYRDGKSWLCKVTFRKKTVFWLAVYDGCFTVGFYFTEKTGTGIPALDIDAAVKEQFASAKLIGKLRPLVLTIHGHGRLNDAYVLIEYKKKCI